MSLRVGRRGDTGEGGTGTGIPAQTGGRRKSLCAESGVVSALSQPRSSSAGPDRSAGSQTVLRGDGECMDLKPRTQSSKL